MTPALVVIEPELLRRVVAEEIAKGTAPVLDALANLPVSRSLTGLMTADEVADHLQIDIRTLQRLVHEGAVPAPLRIGGRIPRWRREDVDAWLAAGGNPVPRRLRSSRRAGSVSSVNTGGPTP